MECSLGVASKLLAYLYFSAFPNGNAFGLLPLNDSYPAKSLIQNINFRCDAAETAFHQGGQFDRILANFQLAVSVCFIFRVW